ncbi:MAG: hypothetical protein WC854_09750 [Bacteroidales bacterium]
MMKMKTILRVTIGAILLFAFSQNITAQTTAWIEVAPGVWKTVVGIPDKLDLFNAAGIKPAVEALSKMEASKFLVSENDIVTEVVKGETYLRFPLVKDEQIFGFGLNFKTVHQRGKILQLHVDHFGGTDNGRTHAPVPFYVSDRGYGNDQCLVERNKALVFSGCGKTGERICIAAHTTYSLSVHRVCQVSL